MTCHACNLSARDTGAGGFLFWGQSEIQSKFQSILSYSVGPCLKKGRKGLPKELSKCSACSVSLPTWVQVDTQEFHGCQCLYIFLQRHACSQGHTLHARAHTHTYILTLIINGKEGRNQRIGEEREEAFQIGSMIFLCNIGGKAWLWPNCSEIIAVEAMKDYWFVSRFLMPSTNCIIMLKIIIRPTSYQILVKELH